MQLPHCRLDLSSVSLPALTTWTRLQALAWIPILLATWLEQEGFEYWRILSASLVLASVASLAWVLRIGRRAPDMVTLLRAFALELFAAGAQARRPARLHELPHLALQESDLPLVPPDAAHLSVARVERHAEGCRCGKPSRPSPRELQVRQHS